MKSADVPAYSSPSNSEKRKENKDSFRRPRCEKKKQLGSCEVDGTGTQVQVRTACDGHVEHQECETDINSVGRSEEGRARRVGVTE